MNFKKRKRHDRPDIVATGEGDEVRRPQLKRRMIRHAFILVVICCVLFLAVYAFCGRTIIEKAILALIAPCGLVWIGLLMLVYISLVLKQKWPVFFGVICWSLLTVFGNDFVAGKLARQIEAPFFDTDPFAVEPYDILVCLGGGTSTAINQRAQGGESGDRVIMAARMYHAGQAKQIVCTGQQTNRADENDRHPSEEATIILSGLGVPNESISTLPGINTSQEMQNIAKMLKDDEPTNVRIGIVSSAWHLDRVIRLAKKNGVNAEPIPSNFMSRKIVMGPNMIVPSSSNLTVSQKILKEYLARLIGR